MNFELGPLAADLSLYSNSIIALCFTDLKSVLIIPYFSNSSRANEAKMYLSDFGEVMRLGGLFLLHKDTPGWRWGLVTHLESSVLGQSDEGKSRAVPVVGVARVYVGASVVPFALLPGTDTERACVLVVPQTQGVWMTALSLYPCKAVKVGGGSLSCCDSSRKVSKPPSFRELTGGVFSWACCALSFYLSLQDFMQSFVFKQIHYLTIWSHFLSSSSGLLKYFLTVSKCVFELCGTLAGILKVFICTLHFHSITKSMAGKCQSIPQNLLRLSIQNLSRPKDQP